MKIQWKIRKSKKRADTNHKCPVQDFWDVGASFENKEIQYCIHQDSGRLLAARPGPKQPKLWPQTNPNTGNGSDTIQYVDNSVCVCVCVCVCLMYIYIYICIHKYVNICIQVYVLFCYISIYVYIDKTVFLILFHFDWPKNWNLCTDVRCFLSFSLHIHAESFGHHRIKHF